MGRHGLADVMAQPAVSPERAHDRLISWKEVAAHLGCSVATAQRWERQEGLPVHRHQHRQLGSIIAFRSEIELWAEQRGRNLHAALPEVGSASLAVLPFDNYTGDPRKEYLCDGFTEELITELGQRYSDRLKLIARTSVMQFKRTCQPVDRVARQLGVEYVVEGSIARKGTEYRVSAQLIEAARQRHVWAECYRGKLRDVFALPQAIARRCAEKLDLAAEVSSPIAAGYTGFSPAYNAYLQARYHWFQLTREAMDRALHYYGQALRSDANFGAAHAGVSAVWQVRGDSGYVSPQEAYPYARAAATRALALSPDSAFVQAIYGYFRLYYEWDVDGGLTHGHKALELNASEVNAHLLLWECYASRRDFPKAGQHIDVCLRLDPFNPFFKCFQGWHLLFAGNFEESVGPLRRSLAQQPSLSAARLGMWGAFYRRGMHAQAVKEACQFFVSRNEPDVSDLLAHEFRVHGYHYAMKRVADALASRARRQYVGAMRVARMYAHAEENTLALEWLMRAVGERTPALIHLAVGWDWASLRQDERFGCILDKVGLSSN